MAPSCGLAHAPAFPMQAVFEALLPAVPPPTPLPVSCLAFTCHFNLVPVQCSLKDPSSSHMLRVLSGTQHGWFGSLALEPAFIEALGSATETPRTAAAIAGV